jgi:hypothetical protein
MNGSTASTPAQIAYVRLASLKAALKLERAGMKSRGGAIRPRVAAEFGLTPRASWGAYIEAIEQKMRALLVPRAIKSTAGKTYGTTFEVLSVDPDPHAPAECWYNVEDEDGEPLAIHSRDCEPCGN